MAVARWVRRASARERMLMVGWLVVAAAATAAEGTAAAAATTAAAALTLLGGQRIAPLKRHGATPPPSGGSGSLLDLPRVEQWAAARGLTERHLKAIYRVVMEPPPLPPPPPTMAAAPQLPPCKSLVNDDDCPLWLRERLHALSFPKRHAADLLLLSSNSSSNHFVRCSSKLIETRRSASGSMKLVIQLPSGHLVETVLIRHTSTRGGGSQHRRIKRGNGGSSGNSSPPTKAAMAALTTPPRYTVCVSSQVGCARACTFCATGTLGLRASLSSAEILEQVYIAQRVLWQRQREEGGAAAAANDRALRNVVFMGMYVSCYFVRVWFIQAIVLLRVPVAVSALTCLFVCFLMLQQYISF